MHLPNNNAFTPKEKLGFVQSVLGAMTFADQYNALNHWDAFVPFPKRASYNGESQVEHVESLYDQLRLMAVGWYYNYRLLELERRIEDLEKPSASWEE